ncbi:hypothetical protein [Streptomyces sp. NPDC003023]|uniref:hypothetical protein n=1 Tax=Streptomyces sp. NPDC003023 TaxID=3364675 RepID=UPI0036837D2A
MTHMRRILPLFLLPLVLTACGTKSAGGGVDRTELEARARALGTEPDMVYVTDVPGYTLARQSVGVIGDHGFGGFYTRPGGGMIELRVDEAGGDPVDCAEQGGDGAAGRRTVCEKDGRSWYRATDTAHEYVREDGGRVIRLSADLDGVSRETLRSAADNAHQADEEELAEVLPAASGEDGESGTERGDLPPAGDGAPQDPAGATAGTGG